MISEWNKEDQVGQVVENNISSYKDMFNTQVKQEQFSGQCSHSYNTLGGWYNNYRPYCPYCNPKPSCPGCGRPYEWGQYPYYHNYIYC